jgi:ACR3 family arsenite transporter
VALNSVFQVLFYGLLAWVFVTIIPAKLGIDLSLVQGAGGKTLQDITIGEIFRSVMIYLGIPFAAGILSRAISTALTSPALLSVLGETINLMTLGGLALAVGILVDDSTVEIENIHR